VNSRSVEPDEIELNQEVEFEINNPSGSANNGYFVLSIDELLNSSKHCSTVPDFFYLYDQNLFYPNETNELVESYIQSAKLVSLIVRLSDFQSGTKLSFVRPDRLDICISYEMEDLIKERLGDIDKLKEELFPDKIDSHSERRHEIFVDSIVKSLLLIDSDQRLGHLIRHLSEVYRSYRRDYDLYASHFSFAKLKSEYDEFKTKQMKSLNGVVQDISTKLLSIPLAYVLIAGQLTKDGGMKNHIIIIGAFVFALIMMVMVGAQYLTLRHIKEDLDGLEKGYKDRLCEAGLEEPFKQLKSKHFVQKLILQLVFIVVVSVFIMSYWLYADYTPNTILEYVSRHLEEGIQKIVCSDFFDFLR